MVGNTSENNLNININEEINSFKKSTSKRTISVETINNFTTDKGSNTKTIKEESYKNISSVNCKKVICTLQQNATQTQKKNSNENNDTQKTINKELPYDYCSSICFPIKKSSNVGNISFDKINKLLKERQLSFGNKKNCFLTQSSSTIRSVNRRNLNKENRACGNKSDKNKNIEFKNQNKVKTKTRRNFSIYLEAMNEDKRFKTIHHWDKEGNLINKPKIKYFCFNDYVDTVFLGNSKNYNIKKSIDENNKLEKKINDMESVISTDKNSDKDKITIF